MPIARIETHLDIRFDIVNPYCIPLPGQPYGKLLDLVIHYPSGVFTETFVLHENGSVHQIVNGGERRELRRRVRIHGSKLFVSHKMTQPQFEKLIEARARAHITLYTGEAE